MTRWQRFKRWAVDPFRTKVDYFEHTRIEHRACPYKLRVQIVESAQERIDRGGTVHLPRGTWHINRSLTFSKPYTALVGATLDGRTMLRDRWIDPR